MDDRPLLTLTRRRGDPAAPTIGDLPLPGGGKIVVLERPRAPAAKDFCKDGKPHPCVPPGEYEVPWTENVHPNHPACYQLTTGEGTPAPDRTNILIHTANWIRELEGCLAPGLKAEVVAGNYDGQVVKEYGVSSSKPALNQLHDSLCRKPFRLLIKEA